MTICDAAYWMGFARDLLVVLGIILGAYLAVTVYARLRPKFMLRIDPRWVGDRLIVRFEIENASAVYAVLQCAYGEVVKPTVPAGERRSHWVTFTKEPVTEIVPDIEGRKKNDETTIFPGEVLAVETIVDCPGDDVVVQAGLQVKLRSRTWWRPTSWWFPEHRQTSTRYFVKPEWCSFRTKTV